ncbi:MAG: hypothetical protein Q4D57_01935 [Clostridia bacterium]|nr:hypothetical protein [Clostridia bacterium]
MKKGLLLAILAMLTSVTLVGCGQKPEEQNTDDSSNTVATDDQKKDEQSDDQKSDEKSEDQNKDENSDGNKDENAQNVDLGEKTIEGESVEGTLYGTGKYRLTKASDKVIVEWAKDDSKNTIEYLFSGDKLSAIRFTSTYENEEQAKSVYDAISKNENSKKSLKNVKIDGKVVSYEAVESEWAEIKDYSKDKIFDEQKAELEKLSKVDDIRSDD